MRARRSSLRAAERTAVAARGSPAHSAVGVAALAVRRRGFGVFAALLCFGAALSAAAAVPALHKLAGAVAGDNAADQRTLPLLIDVRLSLAGTAVSADGVLATHPTGLARLEIRSNSGFVERHLLLGSEVLASRDGRLLDAPRPFLPPLFLLQAAAPANLEAALASFGVDLGVVEFGMLGDRDCFVIGGRHHFGDSSETPIPSLWIDAERYTVLQFERADGVRFRFGPEKTFAGLRLPSSITIESPDQAPARLDLLKVVPAEAPAAAFNRSWLTDGGPR